MWTYCLMEVVTVGSAKTLYWLDEDEALLQDVKTRLGLRGDSDTVKAALRALRIDLIANADATPAQRIERIERELAEIKKVLK